MQARRHEARRMPHRRLRHLREQIDEALLICGSTVKTLMNVTSVVSFAMTVMGNS
jgi:hypothetical protein